MLTRFGVMVVIVLVVMSFLCGCSGIESSNPGHPDITLLSTSKPESSTTGGAFSSPIFASPLAAPANLEPLPEPLPNRGVVTGILVLDGNPSRPMQGAILYLGEVIKLEDGQPAISGLDKRNAPVTQTNAAGQFIFKDVPPGEYTLIFDLVVHSFLLSAPSGGDLIIKVTPGEIIDLGELRYRDLPDVVQPVPNN